MAINLWEETLPCEVSEHANEYTGMLFSDSLERNSIYPPVLKMFEFPIFRFSGFRVKFLHSEYFSLKCPITPYEKGYISFKSISCC